MPRHPERFEAVAPAAGRLGHRLAAADASWRPHRRSAEALPPRVLLVDVVGELGAWWGTAEIAFVGGSLGNRGGQNMIEPAAYGAAVSFGPNTRNFRDIVATMLARQAAVVVADEAELTPLFAAAWKTPPMPPPWGAGRVAGQEPAGATATEPGNCWSNLSRQCARELRRLHVP